MKQSHMWLLLVLVGSLCLPKSSFGTEPQAFVDATHTGYHKILLGCPDLIWPGSNWSNLNFLLFSHREKKAWLIGADFDQPKVLLASEFALPAQGLSYSFGEIESKTTVFLATDIYQGMDISASRTFRLGVHELFHRVFQKNWVKPSKSRWPEYPLEWKPRYLRRMLFDSLKAALLSNQSMYPAIFWYQRWRIEFPEELSRATDGYEGSARYIDLQAATLSRLTCAATKDEVKADYLKYFAYLSFDTDMDLDLEGYYLGSLGLFMLDLRDGTKNWTKQLPLGKTPLELLLNGYAHPGIADNDELAREYREKIEARNLEVEKVIGPEIDLFKSKDALRIAIPASWKQPDFYNTEQSYLVRELKNLEFSPLAASHSFSSQTGSITLSKGKALFIGESPALSPCPDHSLDFFLLAKAAVKSEGAIYSCDPSSGVSCNFIGSPRLRDGVTWICPR